MGLSDIAKSIKQNQHKKGRNRDDVYISGYYMLGGFVSSFLISYLWDNYSPKKGQKITEGLVTGLPIQNVGEGVPIDKVIIMTISAFLTLGELWLNIKGGASSGAGMMLGYVYLDKSREGKYVGNF